MCDDEQTGALRGAQYETWRYASDKTEMVKDMRFGDLLQLSSDYDRV